MNNLHIVVPTFNRSQILLRFLENLSRQSYKKFTTVVVDDGSTDDTAEKLSAIDDPRLIILHMENGGVSAARNFAVENSCGSYIALLDSDDEWLPEKLEKQLEFMESEGLEISQTDEIWIRKGKRVNQCKKHEKPEGFFFERSLAMCMVSPSCVMFTRKFRETVGAFDERMAACEDYDLWLRGSMFPVGLLRERLTVKHGGRDDQLSNSVGCLDLYRMYSIAKLLASSKLDAGQRKSALAELERKSGYFCGGCRKRDKVNLAKKIEQLVSDVVEGRDFDSVNFLED